MRGKVCVLTGTTSGLGTIMAAALAREGATVVMLNRDLRRSRRVQRDSEVYAVSSAVHSIACDTESPASVAAAADAVLAEHEHVDLLINNPSGFYPTRRTTADGLEVTLRANYLAHFELTTRLLDRLRASGPSRIVSVVGKPEFRSGLVPGTARRRESGYRALEMNKLRLLVMTLELSRRLAKTSVTANGAFPGILKSPILEGTPLRQRVEAHFRGLGAAHAADIVVEAATVEDAADKSGGVFGPSGWEPAPTALNDPALGEALWRWSEVASAPPGQPETPSLAAAAHAS